MKSFIQLIEETDKTEKPVVVGFGRFNPPSSGHLKVINKVKEHADKLGADHKVIVSHSHDSKKNPLSPDQKIKHLKRYAPGIHFEASSKESPSILHHAAKLHDQGHDHLVMVAGSDRVKEFHDLLHKYNGKKGAHGKFDFKKIDVKSSGYRDPDSEGTEGVSATKMRDHAKNKDFSSFRHGVPAHVSDQHARELMTDTRKGMGLHENVNRGLFKAIFITGAPGSGKDVVLRESIAESRITEMNFAQTINILNDKQRLSEKSNDVKTEAIRNRQSLIINGPSDDKEKIEHIKEELESLGYETMIIFVATSNEISKERNSSLSRMMSESIRQEKWDKSQQNKKIFTEMFEVFFEFNNNQSLESNEEYITETYELASLFLDTQVKNEDALDWMKKNNKKIKKLNDNNSMYSVMGHKLGKKDDVRDGDVASNSSYAFKTYEDIKKDIKEGGPVLIVKPQPRETKFSMDNDKEKKLKKKVSDLPSVSKRVNAPGVGPQYDTRNQGSTQAIGGLGDVTYKEHLDFKSFRARLEAIDDPGANDMGVAGVTGGATNKEPMEVSIDKTGQYDNNKKIKKVKG